MGSVPPGAINLTAIKISLDKGYRAVVSFALAAALVEFAYGLIAVYGSGFFLSHPGLNGLFENITVAVFLAMGIGYFFQQATPATTSGAKRSGSFAKGIMLSIFNPLGIPFWLAYTSFLQVRQWIHLDPSTTFFYVFGIAAGAFAALIRPHTHDYTALAVSGARAQDGTLRLAATGTGSWGARLPSAEAAAGDPVAAGEAALQDVTLHDDALASAWYRTKVLPVLVRRVLAELKESA